MKTNEKKNTSAKKKLIPAVAMLTTSAVMLSTATYAWFTMSREVEVTGIKLTATTPQTIEVSLGKATAGATITSKTEATEPGDDEKLWSNKAATSSVYASFGKLIPASTTDGLNLYYTTKATENGKNVDISGENAFIKATETNNAGWTFQADGKSSAEEKNLTADTDGEGYYLDIPVWFRTTNITDVNLGVDVTVTDPNSESADTKGDLYKATRVAFLTSDKTTAKGVFLGAETDVNTAYYKKKAVKAATGTGEDSYYGNVTVAKEVTANAAGQVTNSDSTDVASVTGVGNGKTGYSTPVKYYIRVWLEGEDKNCWNANAGQSFNVDLKFYDLSNTGVAD